MVSGSHYIITATNIDIKTENSYNIRQKVITQGHIFLHLMCMYNLLGKCS